MGRKRGVIGVVAALLISALLAGISRGVTPARGVTRSAVDPIVLRYGDRLKEAKYPLRDDRGERSGQLSVFRGNLLDEDGNDVGVHRCECLFVERVAWTCTHILSLRPGPFTSRGTVVITGAFRGFVGERLAVTGGTGAYANVAGYATSITVGRRFAHTLYLSSFDDAAVGVTPGTARGGTGDTPPRSASS